MEGVRQSASGRSLLDGAVRPSTTHSETTVIFRSKIGPLILIVLGALFLLSNLGLLPELRPLLSHWWPLILIAVGVYLLVRR